MFCIYCGHKIIEEGARFCSFCGKKLPDLSKDNRITEQRETVKDNRITEQRETVKDNRITEQRETSGSTVNPADGNTGTPREQANTAAAQNTGSARSVNSNTSREQSGNNTTTTNTGSSRAADINIKSINAFAGNVLNSGNRVVPVESRNMQDLRQDKTKFIDLTVMGVLIAVFVISVIGYAMTGGM